MPNDKEIRVSLNNLGACLLWMLAAIVWSAGFMLRDFRFGQAACILSAAAATVHVRGFLCTFHKREKRVFELGREKGRMEVGAEVPLQRVR